MNKNIEQKIAELERRVQKLELADSSRRHENQEIKKNKKISAKEFLLTKKLTTDTQKTIALGYYLEHEDSMISFNVDDLIKAFANAKERKPSNVGDAVNKNISRGFIMEASERKDGKKAWTLTSTGEKFVEKLSK
jgi:hypothetical protein